MDKQRIRMSDIVIGQPLPWNVFDAGNKLLLRKGFIVVTEGQIDKLIEQGLFVEGHTKREAEEPPPKENPSALRHVNRAARHLEKLFLNLSNEGDAAAQFREIAREIAQGLHVNADVCVASILLNQGSSSLPVRHSVNVAILSCLVARAMGRPDEEIEAIVAAALTMNLGMLDLQARLASQVSPLTAQQREHIRNHPVRSVEMLSQAGVTDADWLEAVLQHHELPDGSGYPRGTTDIGELAEMLRFADVYTARLSARATREAMSAQQAGRELHQMADASPLASALIKSFGIFPPGSVVRLASGEMGLVVRNGEKAHQPFVAVPTNSNGEPRMTPATRDTSLDTHRVVSLLTPGALPMRLSDERIASLIGASG